MCYHKIMKLNYIQRVFVFVVAISFAVPVCADQDAELIAQRNRLRQEVKKGMTEAEVRKIMGPPDEVNTVNFIALYSPEYRYAYGVKQPGTLPFIVSVFFGSQAKVVEVVACDVQDFYRKTTAETFTEWEMKSYRGLKLILLNAELPGKKTGNKLASFSVEIENMTNQGRRLEQGDRLLGNDFFVTVYSSSRQVLFNENSVHITECRHTRVGEFSTLIQPNSKFPLSFRLFPYRFRDPLPSGKYYVRVWFLLDGWDIPPYPSNLVEVEIPGN
ncbi:MAG: hypothetical protein DRJ08_07015 [Acidobacteria bacterium]|nr:MAG: hypothetical protein DRJ08_07015 [Acidobacteriota bacterium]